MDIPDFDISFVRRYSLADLDSIDFSTSDDYAIVVENLKSMITLGQNVETVWNEEHEQLLWQYVIDPESNLFVCYFFEACLVVKCSIPDVPVLELFYFIKISTEKLTSENCSIKIICGRAASPYFESLYELLCIMYLPIISEHLELPKYIKSDYLPQISKYIRELSNLRSKLQGELVLYVPREIENQDTETIIEQKQLLDDVERAVMTWTVLLVDVVTYKAELESKEYAGPYEEIAFWEQRVCDLDRVLLQLKRKDVQKCIDALKLAKLGSVYKIDEISQQLQSKWDTARNNVTFLSILNKSCQLLEESSLTDIPLHLNKLLDLVRIIWKNSSYFNSNDQIANLLGKVNNFVLNLCSKFIPLNDIFSSENIAVKATILDVIQCCQSWIKIFEFSEKVHKKYAPKMWSVDSISSSVNLFINRCEELLQVCNFKEEFQCNRENDNFRHNHKCFEVAEQLQATEAYFQKLVQELAKSKETVLDIKIAVWYDYFKKFKTEVYNLEVAVSKLMLNAFENLNTVEEGIQILELFKNYFEKEVIKRDLQRCIETLYDIFFKEANIVKQKLVEMKALEFPLLPVHGGTAFHISVLSSRMKQVYKVLQTASHMWSRKYDVKIEGYYQEVLDAVNELIHTLFLQWTKTIPKDPYSWIKFPILKYDSAPYLELNISSDILILIKELFYWEKTCVEIPLHLEQIHEKSDVFSKRILKMQEIVKKYNRIIGALSLDERDMFVEVLSTMEDSVRFSFSNLTWASSQSTLNTSLKSALEQIRSAKEIFGQYEKCNIQINNMSREIAQKCMFISDIGAPMEFSDFLQMQVLYKQDMLQQILNLHEGITDELQKMVTAIRKKNSEANQFFLMFVKKVAESVSVFLAKSFEESLKAFNSLFGINRKNKIRIIFNISLTLRDHQLYFDPNFKELCSGIDSLIDSVKDELSNIKSLGEIFFENSERNNQFLEILESSSNTEELRKEIDCGLYQLYIVEQEFKSEWSPFSSLWETNKSDLLKKYQESHWKASEVESDINGFLEIAKKISSVPRYKVLDFCVVDCQLFKEAAILCSDQWRNELGAVLCKISHSNLQAAYDLFELTSLKFKDIPQNLEELKYSIRFLIRVKKHAADIHSTFTSIFESCIVLRKFGISFSEKSLDQLQNLDANWKQLEANLKKYYTDLQKVQATHQRYFLTFHEKLKSAANSLKEELSENGPFTLKFDYDSAMVLLLFFKKCLLGLKKKEFQMNKDAVFFHIFLEPLEMLKVVEQELEHLKVSWIYVKQHDGYTEEWSNLPIVKFDVPSKRVLSDNLQRNIKQLKNEVQGTHWVLLDELLSKVDNLNEYYEMILNFQDSTLQKRHWDELRNLLNLVAVEDSEDFFKSADFTFSFLQNLEVENLVNKVSVVATQARKEYEIEKSIEEVGNVWMSVCFDMKDFKTFYKLEGSEIIVSIIENHQMNLRAMKGSKYVGYFANKVDSLENSLSLILDVIEQVESFQSKFFLLENIFGEQTIQAQLPKEATEFENVTSLWKDISVMMKEEKLAWDISHKPGFFEVLYDMNGKAEEVEKCLEAYLESKRRTFPRLYFLSNDDLLSIIGQDSPLEIQRHLKKLFDNLDKLEIVQKMGKKMHEPEMIIAAVGMYSKCHEYVKFIEPIHLDGPEESWLLDIERMMHLTLSTLLPNCLHILLAVLQKEDINFAHLKWLNNWPGQICSLSLLVAWTAEVTASIKTVQETAVTTALKNLRKKWRDILNQSAMKLQNETQILIQMKAMNIIILVSHACDVIDSLLKYVCNDVNAFEWLVHLRFYYEEEKDECLIRQAQAMFKYGFEFLGNCERLVITPLTDRCFHSLTTALCCYKGASLKGLQGVGKTETLKDLSRLLGNYTLVINCSHNLDHISLIRMVSGIAQIGAWGCFEEFSCIKIEILSVLSQEINSILNALSSKRYFFPFWGMETPVHENCGLFLTINPVSYYHGYNLPPLLSDLFRPVSMISPDIEAIIQINLFALGFKEPKILAADIYLMYKMIAEQLSKKNYYSFDLRSVCKFLKVLRKQKRSYENFPDHEVIAASLRNSSISELHADDVPIFEDILENILSGVKEIRKDLSVITNALKHILSKRSLQPTHTTLSKIIQFFEKLQFHHAIILLGDSGCGKTTTWKTLKEVFDHLQSQNVENFSSVHTYLLNPKAFSNKELFGHFKAAGVWQNGLFPTVLKKANQNEKFREKWIILDGPIDDKWVGNIHALLDSSKVLTVSNGERILLLPEVSVIFETTDIIHCSPSVISRCGIVYHGTATVSYNTRICSWLQQIENDAIRKTMEEIIDIYFEYVIDFSFSNLISLKFMCSTSPSYISSFCKIVDAFIKKLPDETNQKEKISKIFWMSIIYSLGIIVDEKDEQYFIAYIKQLDVSLPNFGSVFDYGLDNNMEWFKWSTLLPDVWEPHLGVYSENWLIPTERTLQYEYILSLYMKEMKPVLIVGKTGAGKTIIIENLLKRLNSDSYMHHVINISPQTTSARLQRMLENKLEKKAGGVLFPPSGRRLIVFLDNFNMAKQDQYGSQSALELLHMEIDNRIWYNRDKWKINSIQNVTFIAAMSPPRRSESKISQPLLNRFNVINIIPPQDQELKRIFITLLRKKFVEPSLDIRRLINAITLGSIKVYKSVMEIFLPTPAKLHYLFSLRDIKKIFYRLLDVNPENASDRIVMTKLWFHECTRELSDRLIDIDDRKTFLKILYDVIENQFLVKVDHLYYKKQEPKFAKFLDPDKGYNEIEDSEMLKMQFVQYIEAYNKQNIGFPLNVIFFKDSLEHLTRIIRGIENPFGNMLLLGSVDTGRHTLSRLAAFILKYQLFETEVEKRYGLPEVKRDLRKLLHTVGVKSVPILFLLSDTQLVDKAFLQYLNDILTTGIPSDLFMHEELEMLYSEIKASSNKQLSRNECHDFLLDNIKQNLHVVFCLNYKSPLYKECILKYPALLKGTTIDWFDDWPDDALEAISTVYLKDVILGDPEEEKRTVCKEILSDMHLSMVKFSKEIIRLNLSIFETSATFINFVQTFKKVLIEKRKRVQQAVERLESGLQKIEECQRKVNEIAKETQEARERLIIAERECDEALEDIKEKKEVVAEKQEAIQEKKTEIEKKERVCKKIAIAAQEDLNAALPALEEAKKALEALNKRDIGEIKSYAKPPVLVEIVLEAVMILRASEPSWAEAKRQLGSPSFLKELLEYDKDNIPDAALHKVGRYLKKPEFQPNIVGKVSIAAKSLCIWVQSMHLYGEIYKKVKPKKERLRIAQEELARLQKTLASLLKELEELEAAIKRLEQEHELLLQKKEEYARTAKILALKLERAESIIEGLNSEKERWMIKVSDLKAKRVYVVGDSFLAAGFLSYLGPYDQSRRLQASIFWKKKLTDKKFSFSPSFDLADFFVDEEIKTEWNTHGLPSDQYSYEGAAVVTESFYCPFLVDPEGQAVKWIRNLEANRKLRCIDFQDSKWISAVEASIKQGFPILLQNMNPDLDPLLRPLLKQSDDVSLISFNDKEWEKNPNFKLYMSTKLLNPRFPCTVINHICIVNFTIKEKGLEDQLLPLVIQNERAELETTKEKLVKSISDNKRQLADIEDTILRLLNEAKGSLLDDEVLVQALKKSKLASLDIEEKLKKNQETELVIDALRDNYRPCAKMASILYFVLTDMTFVDSMYVFTLDSYITLFLSSISKSPRDPNIPRRISNLNAFHQRAVYRYACRTICEKHSLLLAFHMCTKIMRSLGKIHNEEYSFFIKGGQVIDRSEEPPNPCSLWLPQHCWDHITQLERLPKFLGITVSFDEISRMWQDWYTTAEPEKIYLPGNWRNICDEFQRLLIIRCLRPDRITNCISNFVDKNLGKGFLVYPGMDLSEIVKESTSNKPLVVFTLSSYIDPEQIIQNLAETCGMADRYRAISLGQGQEVVASQLIVDAAKLGFWAFLSNCHLLTDWFPALEKIVNKIVTLKIHPNFRLWLGLHPASTFPTSVLQNSMIITLESPKGIKANMLKLYDSLKNEDEIESSGNMGKYKSLLFTLSFFHSVLLERNRFQHLGWNNVYMFTEADFQMAKMLFEIYLNDYKDTPWDALKDAIEITYGGHLTDDRDEMLLTTYYEQYFCDEVYANIKFPLSSVSHYYVPEEGPMSSYVQFIRNLPTVDVPEVFEQHCNAEIPYRIHHAEELLKNMSKFQNKSFTQSENMENQVIVIISEIKEHLPSLIDKQAVTGILQDKTDPYCYILMQESEQYNALVELVSEEISDLEESIQGKRIINQKLEELSDVMLKMEVPRHWQKAYPSLKPLGSWIQDLKMRVEQFHDWSSSGSPPIKFWLPGFTAPRSVLNAALQISAKENDVMLRDLVWEYHVSTLDEAHIKEAPPEGIYARGLFLEGAGWDKTNSILIEPEPLQLFTPMPVIHFKPVLESSMRGLYNCPCYYTSKRTDENGCSSYLFSVDLKTKKPKEHWIKRGTSLILCTKY